MLQTKGRLVCVQTLRWDTVGMIGDSMEVSVVPSELWDVVRRRREELGDILDQQRLELGGNLILNC